MKTSSGHLTAPALALALVVSACAPGDPSDSRPPLPLALEFSWADTAREQALIDFGTVEAQSAVIEGFDPRLDSRQGNSSGVTWQWSRGDRSEVEFFLAGIDGQNLELRAAALEVPEAAGLGPQAVSLTLNEQALGDLVIGPTPAVHRIDLPPGVLRVGANRLALRYAWAVRPRDIGIGRDSRRLAVRWDWLSLAGPPGAIETSAAMPEQRIAVAPTKDERSRAWPALDLPGRTVVDFFLDLGAEPRIIWQELTNDCPQPVHLQLRLTRADGGDDRRDAQEIGGGNRDVHLSIEETGIHRLRVTNLAPPGCTTTWFDPALYGRGPRLELIPQTRQQAEVEVSERPDVYVYLVDTLRADRLGTYGQSTLTPAIDAFAEQSIIFDAAIGTSSWTQPSVASLFTGTPPDDHGVLLVEDKLPEEAQVLAEQLQLAAYRTAALSNNFLIRESTGFDQGFDAFEFVGTDDHDAFIDLAISRLEGPPDANGLEPTFFYVHTSEPHLPYDPPPDLRAELNIGSDLIVDVANLDQLHGRTSGPEKEAEMALVRQIYDAEVREADRNFARFIAALEDRGRYDESLIIFTSDHGEEFEDHGTIRHGRNLYRPTLQVPLLIKPPRSWWEQHGEKPPLRIASPAGLIDLSATILAAAGLEPPPEAVGRNLLAAGASARHSGLRFASLYTIGPQRIARDDHWKLLWDARFEKPALLDLRSWPGEQERVEAQYPLRYRFMNQQFERWRKRYPNPEQLDTEKVFDPATVERLRALGYLE